MCSQIQPPDPRFPFVEGSYQNLNNAFDWAEKYGIGIWLDYHAHNGSQNGYASWRPISELTLERTLHAPACTHVHRGSKCGELDDRYLLQVRGECTDAGKGKVLGRSPGTLSVQQQSVRVG